MKFDTIRAVKRLLFLLPAAVFFGACSMRTAAVRVAGDALVDGASSMREEADPALAEAAFPGQIKLIEGLLANDPGNPRLRLLAAEAHAAYAFLFLEEAAPERAKGLYERAQRHAWAARCPPDRCKDPPPWARPQEQGWLAELEKKDVPWLFWLAFAAAGKVNLSRDSSEELARLPLIEAMMRRVWELDKEFQFAGADLFFGAYYASRPAMLGGDKGKAKTHFEWARRLTAGRYLLAYVFEARYLAVALQDRALFEQLLKRVLEAQAGGLPGARLADEVAKKRAAALLEKADDYF